MDAALLLCQILQRRRGGWVTCFIVQMLHGVEVGRMLLFLVAGSTPVSYICPFWQVFHTSDNKNNEGAAPRGAGSSVQAGRSHNPPVSTTSHTFSIPAKKGNKGRFVHIPQCRAGYRRPPWDRATGEEEEEVQEVSSGGAG